MYISTKPTTYLIDGLNMVRSFLSEFGRSEDDVTEDFLQFLEEASQDERYNMNTYEVIFDGAFRNIGPLYRGGVHISFSEGQSADDVIRERANYLVQKNARVIAVTDDRGLQNELRDLGVKTFFCRKFYTSFKFDEK
jgi:predicted RNA-binding protein with PIN domain